MAAVDIGQMTDEDLRDQLKVYGVNVGPITSSTRLFYEKKLGKLMDQGDAPAPETESEEDDDNDDDDDDEVQINYRAQESRPPAEAPRPKPQVMSTPVEPQRAAYKPITQPRTAQPTTPYRRPTAGRAGDEVDKPAPMTSGGESSSGRGQSGRGRWIKLLLVVVLAFLVYLVIVNMNPSAENKIPLSIEDTQG